MARIKAAIKYIRKTKKNRARNVAVKNNVRRAIKNAIAAIGKKEKDAKDKVKSV